MDVLRLLAQRGPISFEALEATLLAQAAGEADFMAALDEAADRGYLEVAGREPGVYRLTRHGRRLLAHE